MRSLSLVGIALLTGFAQAAGVTARFDPASPVVGPFPTDSLTIDDPAQKTGKRINLPLTDCGIYKSACEETTALNEFDGFSLSPRVVVRFSGPVNLETLRDGVFFVALDNLTAEEYGLSPVGGVIPINQLIWDPETLSLYAKPDNVLDQHRRYALVVTSAVRDTRGNPVEADPAFLQCLTQPPNSYCAGLGFYIGPLNALAGRLGATRGVIAASVFTTMSATAWLEKARDQLPLTPSIVQPTGSRNVFAVQDVNSIVFRQHRTNPTGFQDATVRTDFLGGVGSIVFGSYRSPNYLDDRQSIRTTPTGSAITAPERTEEIFFQALLPASPKPVAGHPVVIVQAGLGFHRLMLPFSGIGQIMAAAGYATISINAAGHGSGPEGRLVITERNGTVTELPAPGRGIDVNRDGRIANAESCRPEGPLGNRDCIRQTVVDLMQLVRSIRAGIDLDGDRSLDFDPERIYYFGWSLGAIYGTLLTAVEPSIAGAVLNAGGGSGIDLQRWSPGFRPGLAEELLRLRTPAIAPNRGNEFEDDYVLRDQPVKINSWFGAIEMQNIYEVQDWLQKPGDPTAYAPHLRASTLPGVPIKRVLFQFAKGDQTIPNPASSAWIRAAHMREWSILYRHDIARAAVPQHQADPHGFMVATPSLPISLAAQRQAALFFSTGERCSLDEPCIPDVNDLLRPVYGRNVFEVPEVLPEELGFLTP